MGPDLLPLLGGDVVTSSSLLITTRIGYHPLDTCVLNQTPRVDECHIQLLAESWDPAPLAVENDVRQLAADHGRPAAVVSSHQAVVPQPDADVLRLQRPWLSAWLK